MEVLDVNMVELDDEAFEDCQPKQLMSISFSSHIGATSHTTTLMRGTVGKRDIVIMLDSGATHNFISPQLASQLKLKIQNDDSLLIWLGTGIVVSRFWGLQTS